jgi:DNA-binding LytR/AlgR family response regulator
MLSKINCIIIEDELPASILLEMHIAKFDFLVLKGKFMSATSASNFLKNNSIDLIFLDINLPEKSGIEFAKTLPSEINIIFTTAYTEHAIDGFNLEAIDYIAKPISLERFSKAINKVLKIQKQNLTTASIPETEKPFVFVKCERRMLKFYLDDILYFESQGNYLLIYTKLGNNYKAYLSISEMNEKLPEELFCRVHRSFLVAIDKITAFNRTTVTVENKQLPIGRVYLTTVTHLLQSLVTLPGSRYYAE